VAENTGLKDGLDLEDMKHLRANSVGFRLAWEMMNTEAFLAQVKHTIKNSEFSDLKDKAGTYDHTLVYTVVPLLMRRLKYAELKAQTWERLFRSAALDPDYRVATYDEQAKELGWHNPASLYSQVKDI